MISHTTPFTHMNPDGSVTTSKYIEVVTYSNGDVDVLFNYSRWAKDQQIKPMENDENYTKPEDTQA